MNEIATRDQLLSATTAKRRYRTVILPAAGLAVRIQSLTEGELSEYQSSALRFGSDGNPKVVRARLLDANCRLIALCVVDGDGRRLFTDEDFILIRQWDAKDAQLLYQACAIHCGINTGDIEELVKNSATTPVED